MILKAWDVVVTEEFRAWWDSLDVDGQAVVWRAVELLAARGIDLGAPHSSKLNGSRHAHMRELRMQYRGRPLRAFCAFDPRRVAVLLVGGDKTGDGRFYRRMIRAADRLYDEHIAALRRPGRLQ